MTTANDPLKSIQSRIDELEQTISDRGEQIKARAHQLKEDLQDELSPIEQIKKHPVESAGLSFVTGIVAGRIVRSIVSPKSRRKSVPVTRQAPPPPPAPEPVAKPRPAAKPQQSPAEKPPVATATPHERSSSPAGMAIGAIGIELIHAVRDMAVTWIKSRGEEKKEKAC